MMALSKPPYFYFRCKNNHAQLYNFIVTSLLPQRG